MSMRRPAEPVQRFEPYCLEPIDGKRKYYVWSGSQRRVRMALSPADIAMSVVSTALIYQHSDTLSCRVYVSLRGFSVESVAWVYSTSQLATDFGWTWPVPEERADDGY